MRKSAQRIARAIGAAAALAIAASPAHAAALQILINTGTADVVDPGVTWNNLTAASTNVPLYYSDGSLSGLTFADITGITPGNDTRYTPTTTLDDHPLDWVSSLSVSNLEAFRTNFSQNAFSPVAPTNLNTTGMVGLTGRDVTVEVVATYAGNSISEVRTGDYFVNGELTTLDGGTEPTYKPSNDYRDGQSNINYMLWQDLEWGAGAFTGDTLTVSFQRENNTTVINGYSINYDLPGIVADFAGGEGATSVDQYGGKAGDGWKGGWNTFNATGSVVTSDPLDGGGNYLQVTNTTATGAGVTRQFGSFIDIDIAAKTYSVAADFRIDSETDVEGFQLGVRGSNAINTTSDVLGYIKATSTTWLTFDGNGDGSADTVNTGFGVVGGADYHIEFKMDPTTMTYWFTLDNLDDALDAYVSDVFSFRNPNPVSMPYFFIGTQHSGAAPGFSLDSVIISVPVPAALPAGLTMLGVFAARRRPRRAPDR